MVQTTVNVGRLVAMGMSIFGYGIERPRRRKRRSKK